MSAEGQGEPRSSYPMALNLSYCGVVAEVCCYLCCLSCSCISYPCERLRWSRAMTVRVIDLSIQYQVAPHMAKARRSKSIAVIASNRPAYC